ncbi:heat-shock protein Hsp20 [Halarcobacter ebronensis]|uniref:Heat-shock protein Hsp20 n=1 Tax=Halarcobacter ebronensis TaxID=1462615 RepID=A0A4Q0YDE4_9BACT|nr:Hsp20/alpha crystallin family protein [Halarcobacter ebronensis]RXJ68045.1 heat-shock protein Hsp20 [Halarcobacter ebronensis]
MNLSKLAPWNWFKNEQSTNVNIIPENKPTLETKIPSRHHLTLHHELDELFNSFHRNLSSLFQPTQNNSFGTSMLKPFLDISSKDEKYLIQIELPGVEKKDINIHIENDMLIVEGEKKQESHKKEHDFYAVERVYGSFKRVLNLPNNANVEEITSSFKDGVLSIEIPKLQIEKKDIKKITIS